MPSIDQTSVYSVPKSDVRDIIKGAPRSLKEAVQNLYEVLGIVCTINQRVFKYALLDKDTWLTALDKLNNEDIKYAVRKLYNPRLITYEDIDIEEALFQISKTKVLGIADGGVEVPEESLNLSFLEARKYSRDSGCSLFSLKDYQSFQANNKYYDTKTCTWVSPITPDCNLSPKTSMYAGWFLEEEKFYAIRDVPVEVRKSYVGVRRIVYL